MSSLLFLPINDAIYPISEESVWEKPAYKNENSLAIAGGLAEALLIADEILIYTPATNQALVILLKWFGENNLVKLLEEKVIKFILLPGLVMYYNSEQISTGIVSGKPGFTWVTGRHSEKDKSWIDPFESAQYALRQQTKLSAERINNLARKTEEVTKKYEPEEIFPKAFELADLEIKYLHKEGLLLPNLHKGQLNDLPFEYHGQYLNIVNPHVYFLLAATVETSILDINEKNQNYYQTKLHFKEGNRIIEGFKSILEYEGMVDVPSLFTINKISFDDIITIRQNKNNIRFRKWFNSINNKKDVPELLREYTAALPKNISGYTSYKMARMAISMGLSCLTGGLASIFIEPGITAAESFVLDKISIGWSPRLFINEINKIKK